MESRKKAQIFSMRASGISSNVFRVTECCMLINMVSTQALKYYRRLLRIFTQMALAPLFSVSSIAKFLAATTKIPRASADSSVSASTLFPCAFVYPKNKPAGYAMFHLCNVTSLVSKLNIVFRVCKTVHHHTFN
jgi:hypothetical protein